MARQFFAQRRIRLAVALIGIVGTTALSACGSGSGGTSAPNASSSQGGGNVTGSAWYKDAQQLAAKAKKKTTEWKVPSPTVSATGKKKRIVIVSCAQASEGCKRASAGAQSAAAALGWKATVIDGKGSVSNYNAAIGQAIALHADGIVLVAVQPGDIAAQVKRARQADINVVSTLSDVTPGTHGDEVDVTPPPYSIAMGKAAGAAAILQTKGKAKVALFVAPQFNNVKDKLTGFKREIKKCTTCKIVTSATFNDATMAQRLPNLTTSTVQAHPDVNLVWNGFDAAATFQVPALDHLGRSIKLVSYDGDSTNVGYIRDGRVQVATVGLPMEWGGWATIDELVRLFNGKHVANEHLSYRLLTKGNLPPKGTKYDGSVDFRSKYKKAWKG